MPLRKAKLIDYKLGVNLLIFSIPAAVLGTLMADFFDPNLLKSVFASGIIFIGWQLYSSFKQEEKEKLDKSIAEDFAKSFESTLTDSQGNTYFYTVCNKAIGRFFTMLGGFFLGMISVGPGRIAGISFDGQMWYSNPSGSSIQRFCGGTYSVGGLRRTCDSLH